jgi:hypothetical protein
LPARKLGIINPLGEKKMNDYTANGFKDRRAYLESLCEEYDRDTVYMLAGLLGSSEDFDGLVTSLEDYADEF